MMERVELGTSDFANGVANGVANDVASKVSLSRLIYGMWRLADDKNTSVKHVQTKVELCIEQGISSMDQADIYGDYACEQLLGNVLKASPALRQQIEIITKCNILFPCVKNPGTRVKHYDTSAEHITACVNASLKKLSTDYLDVLLLHRPDPLMDASVTGAALDALIDSGKVRAVGVSNFKHADWQLLQSGMKAKLVTNQIELNVLHPDPFCNGDIAYLQKDKMLPMAWSPLAGGRLFTPTTERELALVKTLDELAKRNNCSISDVAIAWLLKHPSGVMPVMGTNNLDRIRSLHKACAVELDRQDWFTLLEVVSGREVP